VYRFSPDVSPGDKIRFPARLKPFRNFNNPGRYNYELAMTLKRLCCAASVSDGRYIVPMGRGSPGPLLSWLEALRRPIRRFLSDRLSPRDEALFAALILGERQGITPELREEVVVSGLGHILAVSGLHIGLVGWLAFIFFKRLLSLSYRIMLRTDIRRWAALMACLTVVAYTGITGFQVSGQRAMIMALAYLSAIILGRERDLWSTLALAGFCILVLDPLALFSISFHLSFGAVIGILWLAPSLYAVMPASETEKSNQATPLDQCFVYLKGLVAVTLAATLFLLPITTAYFHRISLVALPANLTTVPILGLWALPCGLLSILSLPISPHLSEWLLLLGGWGLDVMMALIRFWGQVPWAAVWVITPNALEIILFYGLLFTLFFYRRRAWAKAGFFCVLLLIAADASYWIYRTQFNRHLEVTYLDVGQGNAALVRFPGNTRMLIDGGGFPTDRFDVGRMVVAPFLLHSKLRRIDVLVLTHPQTDHMNGLRFIAAHFKPRELWSNGQDVESPSFMELMDIVEKKGIRKQHPTDLAAGRTISGVRVDLLYPLPGQSHGRSAIPADDLNNHSLVLRLSDGSTSFLFPGDLEAAGEARAVQTAGPRLKSDILLAPHHGSKTSCTPAFLRMVQPEVCVISCGHGNWFGFPHAETLKKLRNAGCRIIRIDQTGAVTIVVGSNGVKARSYCGLNDTVKEGADHPASTSLR
jgi:competence protein ComEC